MLYNTPSQHTVISDSVKFLHQAGKLFLVYGKKIKPVVLDACDSIKKLSRGVLDSRYMRYQLAKEVVDCIQGPSSEEITTALPTEIIDFYNSTIAPNITGINNRSELLGTELNAVNGSFKLLHRLRVLHRAMVL